MCGIRWQALKKANFQAVLADFSTCRTVQVVKKGKKKQPTFKLRGDENLTKGVSFVGFFFFFLNTIQSFHSPKRP